MMNLTYELTAEKLKYMQVNSYRFYFQFTVHRILIQLLFQLAAKRTYYSSTRYRSLLPQIELKQLVYFALTELPMNIAVATTG